MVTIISFHPMTGKNREYVKKKKKKECIQVLFLMLKKFLNNPLPEKKKKKNDAQPTRTVQMLKQIMVRLLVF